MNSPSNVILICLKLKKVSKKIDIFFIKKPSTMLILLNKILCYIKEIIF